LITRVLNITLAKRQLLRLVDEDCGPVLLTKGGQPVATLRPMKPATEDRPASLVVLGARPCGAAELDESRRNIQKASSLFDSIVWVYGEQTVEYLDPLEDLDILAVENSRSAQPIITSLKAALACLPEGPGWFMIMLLNRPAPHSLVRRLLQRIDDARALGKSIIIPYKNDKPSHPLLLSLSHKPRIMGTRKELGLPHIIRRHRDDIVEVPT